MKFFKKIFGSLDNHTVDSYSGRKLTTVTSIAVAAYVTIFLLPEGDRLHALYAWLLVALLCLSIITVQNVIELKNGNSSTKTTTTATTETTTEKKPEDEHQN
jgi:hypothetical protein